MTKIGRNDTCPCGSGLKYKRCCLKRVQVSNSASPMEQLKTSLMSGIEKIQRAAQQREEVVRELGVFVLWANGEGDAWLLETTENDGVQLARSGALLEVPINESSETIEIRWSHTFEIRDQRLFVISDTDKAELCLETSPTKRISAAIKRIKRKYSEEVLNHVHIKDSPHERQGFES